MSLKPGTKLANGAIVVAFKVAPTDPTDGVVLAIYNSEYVTWRLDPERLDSTWLGHYFLDNFSAAAADFEAR